MKRIIIALICIAASVQLNAQIDPTVEVSRKYEAGIQDMNKPFIPTEVADSLERFDISFDYSIFNRQYSDLYEFTPYDAAQLSTVGTKRAPFFYAKIGTQFPVIPTAEIYLQGGHNKGFYGSLYGNHNSFWGQLHNAVTDEKYDSDRMASNVGGNLCYAWEEGEFKFDANYNFDRYNYSNVGCKDMHSNNYLNISANLSSARAEDNSVYYDITAMFRKTNKTLAVDNSSNSLLAERFGVGSISENFLSFKGNVGATFDIHRIYINMNIEYAAYSKTHDFSSGVVELSPIYQLERNRLNAKVGVKFGSKYTISGKEIDTDVESEALSNFFPDLDLRYSLIPRTLWVHLVAGGGNDLNPFAKLLRDCPVLVPSVNAVSGKRTLDSRLALEGLLFGKLSLSAFGAYVIHEDHLLYRPERILDNSFRMDTEYRDFNQFSVGAEIFLKTEDLSIEGAIKYNSYRDSSGTGVKELPQVEGKASARYNFRERIIAQFDLGFRSSVEYDDPFFASVCKVPAILDMDFNLNFIINKNVSVFGKVGNILDKRNQYMPLYVEPGRNFGGGVCVTF